MYWLILEIPFYPVWLPLSRLSSYLLLSSFCCCLSFFFYLTKALTVESARSFFFSHRLSSIGECILQVLCFTVYLTSSYSLFLNIQVSLSRKINVYRRVCVNGSVGESERAGEQASRRVRAKREPHTTHSTVDSKR